MTKVMLFANTDWYLYNFRRSLARELRTLGFEVVLVSPPGMYGERMVESGFRWIPIRMDRRGLNPFRELATIFALARLIRRENPDLIHSFTVKCSVYGSLAARIARTDTLRVNAIAGLGYVFSSKDVLARALRPVIVTLFRFSLGGHRARVIVQNAADGELLRRAGVARATTHLIPSSGVDCEKFNFPERTPRPTAEPLRVLLAARLLKSKGIAEYVESAQLMVDGSRIELLLAGTPDPGNPDSVPETLVRDWESRGLVRWLGHVDDMSSLLRDCDVMVLPSYYGEGLPRTLVEAAAAGMALISTDMPGCRDAVVNGVTGFIVPPRDAASLAKAIETLALDRHLVWTMGRAARARVIKEFDERIVIDQTLHVYRGLGLAFVT